MRPTSRGRTPRVGQSPRKRTPATARRARCAARCDSGNGPERIALADAPGSSDTLHTSPVPLVVRRVLTMRERPSGDQSVGSQYAPGHGSSCATPVPSAAAMLNRRSFIVAEEYANRLPSGDHTGMESKRVAVGTRTGCRPVGPRPRCRDCPELYRAYAAPSASRPGTERGDPCTRRSDNRPAVPSRATVPSRMPYAIGIAAVASNSGDHQLRLGWAASSCEAGNVRGSPTRLSAAASKGRTCNWPSAAERSTPRSGPDATTNTASDSDRKSSEAGVDAGRSMRAHAYCAARRGWPSRRR